MARTRDLKDAANDPLAMKEAWVNQNSLKESKRNPHILTILTNAIILLVGVYHNQKEPGQVIITLTDALLDYDISHIVIQPHSVQAILDKQG